MQVKKKTKLVFGLCWARGRVEGCAHFHSCFIWGRRVSTYREVSTMGLQLVLSLMLFGGRGGGEQTVAVRSAGGRQVLAGVFVFRCVGEG